MRFSTVLKDVYESIYHFYFILLHFCCEASEKLPVKIAHQFPTFELLTLTVYVPEAGGGMFVLLRINLNNMQ